ncbi:peptidoglycan DL-endopeptidase CwlO precursor [Desulfosporosinus acididurans]|uniref:Peptidoglycan DL-endopeptidase CwlO n=1 Tax=Desulfosporosinus acididurans TaxID=476652 RepID=A0A0J1FPG6_9FIRM|nr:NlpC/P60 family protein [Desulfosporosinus acididurans]KLU64853.1 peptidoglycan DL-endopeptidase CwlO precursor [Desulfosporosinus acididurans]
MFRRILVPVLVIFLISLSSNPVHAANLQANLHTYQNQFNTLKQQAESQTQQKDASIKQAQSIQASINLLQASVNHDNSLIQQHEQTITNIKNQEDLLTIERQKDIENLGNYLRTEYEQGNTGYLNQLGWLLGSKSLDDLLSRVTYINSLINAYKTLGDQIQTDDLKLQSAQQSEQNVTDDLTKTVQSKQQTKNDLDTALSKQKDLITSLTQAEQKTIKEQNQVQTNIDETQRLIEAQEREAALAAQEKAKQQQAEQEKADQSSKKLTAPVKPSGTVGQILSFAESFLGSPYVWGGSTPNPGFDCSGFVQYVYAHYGISLYRVTWDQYQEGISVPKTDLKPGDLVFFSTYAPGASHVGIYVGNEIMIDDSDYGVAYDSIDHPYWAARYLGARRVIAQ